MHFNKIPQTIDGLQSYSVLWKCILPGHIIMKLNKTYVSLNCDLGKVCEHFGAT